MRPWQVGGLFIAIVQTLKGKGKEADAGAIALGMKYLTFAHPASDSPGFWFQMRLPRDIMHLFLEAVCTLFLNFLLSLLLIIQTLYFGLKKAVWALGPVPCWCWSAAISMRDMVTLTYLNPFFRIRSGKHRPVFRFPLFAFSLFVSAGLIWYVTELAHEHGQT
ncbi:MAG: hypothetical protein R2941_07090 [Desulfobacterales bacterium]